MTTYTAGQTTALNDPLRIPPIAVDLLPAEISERRQHRKNRTRAIVVLVLALVVAVAAYVAVMVFTAAANLQLDDANAKASAVRRQQQQYADLANAQAQKAAIDRQLSTLMASDLRWAAVLAGVRGAAPGGLVFASITGTTGGAPATAGGAAAAGAGAAPAGGAARLPDTSGKALVGTLTITGTAKNQPDVSRYLEALATVPGVGNPILDSVTKQASAKADFSLHMDITAAAQGGRFSTKPGGS